MKTLLQSIKQLIKQYLIYPDQYPAGRLSSQEKALFWLARNEHPEGGIRVHSLHPHAYPEVTGYLIPTLLDHGEDAMARRFYEWLTQIEKSDGAFPDPNEGKLRTFDTGQILRGYLALSNKISNAHEVAKRIADYLYRQLENGGRRGFKRQYSGDIPESVLLYVLPALKQAGEYFNHRPYQDAAEYCADYYLSQDDTLNSSTLTHFLAYQIEGLIDIGRAPAVKSLMNMLRTVQTSDGSVRGVEGETWVCTPGLAQLALCWYKLKEPVPADRALGWLKNHQEITGGWKGSYGAGAVYFPKAEISWAVKFFLDASWASKHLGE